MTLSCEKDCKNFKFCKIPCMYMEQDINGKYRRREPLLRYPIDSTKQENYNLILSGLIRERQIDKIEDIRSIEDLTLRAIAAMLHADLSVREIARILRQTARNIYRRIDLNKERVKNE